MKTIFKLFLLGIIAGATYKYLDNRDINIGQAAYSLYEWMDKTASSLKELATEEGDLNSAPDTDARSAYDRWSSAAQPPVTDYSIKMESPVSEPERVTHEQSVTSETPLNFHDAVEYPVAEKRFTGTPGFPGLDSYAANAPSSAGTSLEALAGYLARPARTDLEKARLLFTWVATHIAYDDYGYNTGNYADCSAEGVLRNRVSVCEGYSNLMVTLGSMAGLEIVKITGYSKGIGYRPGDRMDDTNHAWNAVLIDGKWRLVDVTWAAGFGKGVNGRLVSVMQFNDYWFDTMPEEFIFSHLPEEGRWQLLDRGISKSDFEIMPYVSYPYFKMGFSGSQCLPGVLNGAISGLPVAYQTKGDITVISAPYYGRIKAGSTMKLQVRSNSAGMIALKNDNEWTYFEKNGNEFTTVVRAKQGELKLMASFGDDDLNYHTFLEYTVE